MNKVEANNIRIALKKPFRYECMWESNGGFRDVVQEAWGPDQPAASVHDLVVKLESVAGSLSRWGRNTFGSVRCELRALRSRPRELREDPFGSVLALRRGMLRQG